MNSSQNNLEKFEEFLKAAALKSIYPPPHYNVIKTLCKRPIEPLLQSAKKSPSQQPIKEAQRLTSETGDGRERIEKTAEWPNSVHGLVAVDFDNTRCWGTGILIGPNIVLTAAHNLYDFDKRIYAKLETMQFLPGINGQQLPFGFVEVEQYFISPNYITERTEDYAILILKEPIGYETGYFGLACLEPEELVHKVIHLYGYPYDKVASKPNTYEMWGTKGMIADINIDRGAITYFIETSSGQDGSGIWYQEGEDFYVCGVHVQGLRGLLARRATLLTRAILEQIYQWISKLDLSGNKIGDEGAKVLTQMTSQVRTLKLILEYSLMDERRTKAFKPDTSRSNLSKSSYEHEMMENRVETHTQNTFWKCLSKWDLNKNSSDEEPEILEQSASQANLISLNLEESVIHGIGNLSSRSFQIT